MHYPCLTPAALRELIASPGGPPVLVLLCSFTNRRVLLREIEAAIPSSHLAVLELSTADNDPVHLQRRLAEALAPISGRQGLDGYSDAEKPVAALLNTFLTCAGREAVLVVVGYEQVESEEVHRIVARLLDFLPPALRVLFCSIAIPPVGLPRLLVRRRARVFSYSGCQPCADLKSSSKRSKMGYPKRRSTMPQTRLPTVIVPYVWPPAGASREDVFVYLRPETNGVRVESLLLGTIRNSSRYHEKIAIAYLANIPGDFIAANRIVEEHYADRLYFTMNGKESFTPSMRRRFEEHFGVPFDGAEIDGAFEAMRRRGWTSEELFELRVDQSEVCFINGQSVKNVDGLYLINYDIPAILHKNHASTDVAVMIFRSSLETGEFPELLEEIRTALVAGEVLSPDTPLSHAVHYSKSPFEQILDAKGYLYGPGGSRPPFETIRYASWLIEHGLSVDVIRGLLRNPICLFDDPVLGEIEEHLFVYTAGDSYEEAYRKLERARAQLLLT